MTPPDVASLVFVLAASTAGAILSRVHNRVVLPSVVVEIVLGIIIGSEVLDIAEPDAYIEFLSNIGLVFLFFFAGLEVVEKHVPRRSVALGTAGWAISLAIGLTAGFVLERAGIDAEGWVLGVALATTALGTLVPILSDAGLTSTPLGRAVRASGRAADGVRARGAGVARERRRLRLRARRPGGRADRRARAGFARRRGGAHAPRGDRLRLPDLIVAIVGIGGDRGAIGDDVGASLIGAGMISVLVFPLVGTALVGRRQESERVESMPVSEY